MVYTSRIKETGHSTLTHNFGKCWPIFQNSFTVWLSSDCVTNWPLNIPPHL